MKVYFGHPVNTYGTELEAHFLAEIQRLFPECTVENPNQSHHQEGYERYKRERGNGMLYYYEEVLPSCDEGAFLPFGDGAWGAGVFGEAKFLFDRGKKVWAVVPSSLSRGGITVFRIHHLVDVKVLTPYETRERVYGPDGFRPYE